MENIEKTLDENGLKILVEARQRLKTVMQGVSTPNTVEDFDGFVDELETRVVEVETGLLEYLKIKFESGAKSFPGRKEDLNRMFLSIVGAAERENVPVPDLEPYKARLEKLLVSWGRINWALIQDLAIQAPQIAKQLDQWQGEFNALCADLSKSADMNEVQCQRHRFEEELNVQLERAKDLDQKFCAVLRRQSDFQTRLEKLKPSGGNTGADIQAKLEKFHAIHDEILRDELAMAQIDLRRMRGEADKLLQLPMRPETRGEIEQFKKDLGQIFLFIRNMDLSQEKKKLTMLQAKVRAEKEEFAGMQGEVIVLLHCR